MFTGSTVHQQQTISQPLVPSGPYRQQEYHLSDSPLVSYPLLTAVNSSSAFAEVQYGRDRLSEHLYTHGRESDSLARQPIDTSSHPYNRDTSSSSAAPPSPSSVNQRQHQYTHPARPGHYDSSPSKRRGIPDVNGDFSLGVPYTDFHSESFVPVNPSPNFSNRSDLWLNDAYPAPRREALRKIKKRREKPHIELAPDQPPTTQGKPRARVYVACLQCRNRKIRCDGAKPICHNCSRRTNGNSECNYDPVPKRRGPDKTPGARQRMARDISNGVDSVPSRRRRRNRADMSDEATDLHEPQNGARFHEVPGPQSLRQGGGESVHLSYTGGTSPEIRGKSGDFPGPDYSSVSAPPCRCHGLSRCPNAFVVGLLPNERRPVSGVEAYSRGSGVEARIILQYSDNNSHAYFTEIDEHGNERQRSNTPDIGSEPSLKFSRSIWWDSLLSLYMSPTSTRLHALTVSQRESASQRITADVRFIFRASNYWFSFFHIPSFFSNFFNPVSRERMQPSLVLAMLALSTFWQSSEIGYGANGRERALRFRDEAQASLDASFNSGWIDETLAQAAWLLALFEVCAHPRHSSERSTSSMVMLDSIIRSLHLTLVDADDPNTSLFPSGTVPAVGTPETRRSQPLYTDSASPVRIGDGAPGCSCRSLKLQEHWPSAAEHAPLWSATPAWDDSWTAGEIRKESCRRLCWSSMILAAGHISYTTAQRSEGLDLFITDPANYALLFSGESVARSPILAEHSSKDTIWALYDRSFLLWHGCIRTRKNVSTADNEKARFAMEAWLEADSLEQALNSHTCALERAFIFQAREYIFNTRMYISHEFQRYIPLVTANVNGIFHRKKAEEWLIHQTTVAERFMLGLHTITGNAENLLSRRPFFVFWFMGQIHRAIALWECDRSLTVALDVCKALIPAIDYLTALWPCPEQRLRYESLRQKVELCCLNAGLKIPPKAELSLSPSSTPETLI